MAGQEPPKQTISQRMVEVKRNEAKALLASKNIQLGSTEMAQKKNPGRDGTPIEKLLTNAHYLELDTKHRKRIYQFDVKVTGVGQTASNNQILRDFTRSTNLDFTRSDRRSTCYAAYKSWLNTPWVQQNLMQNGNVIYYDLQNILYAVKEIQMDSNGLQWEFQLMTLNQQTERVNDQTFHTYFFTIKPTTKSIFLDQIQGFVSNDSSKIDRSLLQFLDIATSQHMNLDRKNFLTFSASLIYMLEPEEYGFRNLPNFSANDSFLRVGVRKASHFIEGYPHATTPKIALIIEDKKSAFHHDKTAIQKLCALLQLREEQLQNRALTNEEIGIIKPVFIGLEMELMHINKIVSVRAISDSNALQHKFRITNNGEQLPEEVTVVEYFSRKYNLKINYPLLPLFVFRLNQGAIDCYVPIEVCNVLDDQRVKGLQQRPKQIREMIRYCAVSPDIYLNELSRLTQGLALENDQGLNEAGIRYNNQLIQVDARVLNHPKIKSAEGQVYEVSRRDAKWEMHRANFLYPPTYRTRWVAYSMGTGTATYQIKLEDWRNFVNLFTQEMRRRARSFPDAASIDIVPRDMNLYDLMSKENSQTEYFLIAHDGDTGDALHLQLKYLERKFDVITQAIKIQTVYDMRSGQRPRPHTIINIANKANVKLGGLNYDLAIDDELRPIFDNTLFVGFSMNHPGFGPVGTPLAEKQQPGNGNGDGKNSGNNKKGSPPTAPGNGNGQQSTSQQASQQQSSVPPQVRFAKPPPSVVGWAANIASRSLSDSFSFEYVGDFVYQEPRREENVTVINQVVGQCIEKYQKQRGNSPKRIVILHNACSEGQFQDILHFEVPLLKHTIGERGCVSTLTIVSLNKRQGVRFFQQKINPRDTDADKNISAGTVIDTGIVHPIWHEFYLNSHVAIKGTARTPRYTLIYDDDGLSNDQLQCMMHYLCFGHQIVNFPTSLPSPIFIAEEYAKRGRNLFNYYYNNGDSNGQDRNGNSIPRSYPQSYEELTQLLGYAHTEFLEHLRVNA